MQRTSLGSWIQTCSCVLFVTIANQQFIVLRGYINLSEDSSYSLSLQILFMQIFVGNYAIGVVHVAKDRPRSVKGVQIETPRIIFL